MEREQRQIDQVLELDMEELQIEEVNDAAPDPRRWRCTGRAGITSPHPAMADCQFCKDIKLPRRALVIMIAS
ncbi:unnamed protein product [Urochloa humidicola]